MKYKIGETLRHCTNDGLTIKILSNKDKYNYYEVAIFEKNNSIVHFLSEPYIEERYLRISINAFELEKLLHV